MGQRVIKTFQGFLPVAAVGDDLGEHRVVVAADLEAGEHGRVDPNPAVLLPLGLHQCLDATSGREETRGRVLGVDAGLDRVAAQHDVVLGVAELLPARHPDLLFHQVDSGDHLRHGVLDLQAGVHLHEEEFVRPVRRDDEFDRTCAGVADTAGGVAGGGPDAGPCGLIEQDRRRLLDDLLMPALQRTFAFTEVDDVAVLIGEDLHLDVAGCVDEVLEEQGVVAEGGCRLASGPDQRVGQIVGVLDAVHTLAATAGTRLDEHREADVGGRRDQFVVGEAGPGQPGYHRNVTFGDRGAGGDLVAHGCDRLGRRSDERDARLGECGREFLVLGEESVAGMNRVGTSLPRRVDDLGDVEVTLCGRGRPDADRDVGLADVARGRVGVGVDGDAANSHAAQGVDDAAGDLAAVGHQDTANGSDHVGHVLTSGRRRSADRSVVRIGRFRGPVRGDHGCRRDR